MKTKIITAAPLRTIEFLKSQKPFSVEYALSVEFDHDIYFMVGDGGCLTFWEDDRIFFPDIIQCQDFAVNLCERIADRFFELYDHVTFYAEEVLIPDDESVTDYYDTHFRKPICEFDSSYHYIIPDSLNGKEINIDDINELIKPF